MAGDKRGPAFAAVVAVLAAVGIYLTMWPGSGDSPAEEPAAPAASSAPPRAASTPLATASDAPFDIYSYLPMTKEQLAAAADLAERFTAAYGTFRFDEDPADYADRLKVFTTADLGNVLARTLTQPDAADETVSTATAKVKEIRSVERTSVVFVVTGTQQIAAKSGTRQLAADYAVTVSQMGTDWRVFDLQPAGEGQDGDSEG
jgi:hypothetical protein